MLEEVLEALLTEQLRRWTCDSGLFLTLSLVIDILVILY